MIVDLKIHSKPQIAFKQLLNCEGNMFLETHKNGRLFKRLGLKT